MQTTLNIRNYAFSDSKTYLFAALFTIGNIILPQLCHLVPQGGVTWLPIYFFTLVGAYKYGWRVGLLTALLSPVINSLLFGMPLIEALPAIIMKSVLLATIAGVVASRYKSASILTLVAVVLSYQIIGTAGEWIMKGDFWLACQDFRIGIPGMLFQIFGGWAAIRLIKA